MSGDIPQLKFVKQSPPIWIVESFLRSGNDFTLAMKNKNIVVGEYFDANRHMLIGSKIVQRMLEKHVQLSSFMKYKVTALYSDEFKGKRPRAQDVQALAKHRGLITPPSEIAPLLRFRYPQSRLGAATLLVMHEPIPDEFGINRLFTLFEDERRDWLGSWFAESSQGLGWPECGFIFLAEEPTIILQLAGEED